jgi:tetratricopeptide (TPR) repeat protein
MTELEVSENPPAASIHPGDCVSVSPPGAGVIVREPDCAWRPAESLAHDLVLLDRQHLVAEHATYCRVVDRLNTPQAVRSCSQWQVDFDPATDRIIVHWLRVLRDGAVIEHTNPAGFRCLQREENLERCIIDGGASLLVLLEDIRPGDVLDTAYTIKSTPRLMADHFSNFTCVSYPVHVGQLFVSFRFPEGRPLAWKSNISSLMPVDATVDGVRELRWERAGIKPLATEDNVPGWYLQGGWIQVSDFGSWQDVASGIHEAWSRHAMLAGLEARLAEIRGAAPGLAERADLAIRFVQDDIRYLSLNVELGGQVPSAPGTVLRRRFGDCKDKALLLARLLEELGLKAYPLLVHTRLRQELRNWLPSPLFDHAIVSYELEGGWYCVDPTISQQGGGPARRFVPRYRAGLPVAASGVDGLQVVDTPAGSDGRLRLEERFEIDPTGGPSDFYVNVQATGSEADRFRSALLQYGLDGVARERQQFYRAMLPGAARLGALEWCDDRDANALSLAERFELPGNDEGFLSQRYHLVDHSPHAITGMLPGTSEKTRKRPYQLPGPALVEHIIQVASPSLALCPGDSNLAQCAEFSFTCSLKAVLGCLTVTHQLELLAEEVPAAGIGAYMAALTRLHGRKGIAVNVPRSRQTMQRRGDEPLLAGNTAAVALVAEDIARESGLRPAVPGATPPPAVPAPAAGMDSTSELSWDDSTSRPRRGKTPQPSAPVPAALPVGSFGFGTSAVQAAQAIPAVAMPARRRHYRPRARLSGNAWLCIWGIVISVGGLFLFGLIHSRIAAGSGQPTAISYEEANAQALRDPELNESYRLLYQSDFAGARKLFDTAGPRHPLSLRAQALGARLAIAEGRLQAADDLIAKWQQLYPTDYDLREIRVDLLIAKRDPAEAVRVATENAAMPQAPPFAMLQLANAHIEARQPVKAEPLLLEFLRIEVTHHRARYLLGVVYQNTGRSGEIPKLWQEAMGKFPQDPVPAVLAAGQFVEAGFKEQAAETLAAACLRIPSSAKLAFDYASLLKSEGKLQDAFERFRRAAELDPSWLDPALNVALILEAANHPDALKAYQLTADRCPRDPAKLIEAARSAAPHSLRCSVVFLERTLKIAPQSDEAWDLLSKAHEAHGNPEKAAAARARNPNVIP